MNSQQRSSTTVPLIASLTGLGLVYLATLAPSLTWSHYGADGGDLITAIARSSLPHPPGFPTYLLFGEFFIRLPLGDPAWRLNLMSASAAIMTSLLTIFTARRLLEISRSPGTRQVWIAAMCAGILLGVAPLFWAQSVITEVYTLAACWVALIVWIALSDAPAWILGFAWGIGLGTHPTVIFLLPIVAWSTLRTPSSALRRSAQTSMACVLGLSIVYGLVIVARAHVPSPWARIDSFDGWWSYISAQIYHGYIFSVPTGELLSRTIAFIEISARQFTVLGALISGVGVASLWSTHRGYVLATGFTVAAIYVFALTYSSFDSIVYLTLALPLMATWLAAGLANIAEWLNRRLSWSVTLIMLILPLMQIAFFVGEMDLHKDYTAVDWIDKVVAFAPTNAIVETDRDTYTFALWYAHDALGKRSDLIVVDRDLWGMSIYRKMILELVGLPPTDLSLEQFARLTDRPLVDADALGAGR